MPGSSLTVHVKSTILKKKKMYIVFNILKNCECHTRKEPSTWILQTLRLSFRIDSSFVMFCLPIG